MNKLLVAPYVGEFGWQLMCWQGFVRSIAKKYNDIIFYGGKPYWSLYSHIDLCTSIEYIDIPEIDTSKGIKDCCWNSKYLRPPNNWNGVTNHDSLYGFRIPKEYLKENIDILLPQFLKYKRTDNDELKNIFNFGLFPQTFVKYGNYISDYTKYEVVIHARNRTDIGIERNWSQKKWDILSEKLSNYGITTIAIGTDAILPSSSIDFRNRPLNETMDLLYTIKFIVGPSSGPMHLGSLCGATQLVWSEIKNEIRYKKQWNPFNTEVLFIEDPNWNPSIDTVYSNIINYKEKSK